MLKVTRSAYYKWNNRVPGKRELENERIATISSEISFIVRYKCACLTCEKHSPSPVRRVFLINHVPP